MSNPLPIIVPLEKFEAKASQLMVRKFVTKFGMLTWQELDAPGEELSWLVEDLLTDADKSIVGGESQSGKSFLAIDLSMAISTGRDFHGKKVKPGLVIYQAGEGARGIKNRLRAYRQYHGIDATAKVPFVLLQSRIDIHSIEGDTLNLIDEINGIRALYAEPLRMVVIDTLSRAMGGADENSGRDMAVILNNIDLIREKTGVHICLVHHLNAGGTKLRGHTSVFANIDNVISVSSDPVTKIRTMKLGKQKDGSTDFSLTFELLALPVGQRDGKTVTSCVVVPVGEKQKLDENGRKPYRPNDGETKLLRAIMRALAEQPMPAPHELHAPPFIKRVVDYKLVKSWLKRSNSNDEADSRLESQRLSQLAKRARHSLTEAGVIGGDQPTEGGMTYIWLTGKSVWGFKEIDNQPCSVGFADKGDVDDDTIPF